MTVCSASTVTVAAAKELARNTRKISTSPPPNNRSPTSTTGTGMWDQLKRWSSPETTYRAVYKSSRKETRNADESEDPCLPVRSRPRRYIQQDAHHDGQADKFDHCDPMFCLRMDLHRRVLSCRARSRSRGEPHLHLRVQFSGVDALSPSSDDRFPRASPHCLTVSILLYAIYSI